MADKTKTIFLFQDKARSTKIWVRNFTIPYPNAKK